jgi:hypothetical protein
MKRTERNNPWIDPLLTQLKLVRKAETNTDLNASWELIEAAHLQDRIGRIASEINETAGYHLLETLFFLPPHRHVLRVRFDRNPAKHHLEIVIRDGDIFLKFTTSKHMVFRLDRYFSSDFLRRSSALIWQDIIEPGETSDEHIQGWMTYLLSGFSKEFRPDLVSAASHTPSELTAMLRKASA